MLHINELTYRIEGRVLLDQTSVGMPSGHKIGLVGRNGTGKTTLLRLIAGEIAPDDGEIRTPKRARIGLVSQDVPDGPQNLLETVLAADLERAALLAEAETAMDPERISDIQLRLSDIGAHSAPARAANILAGLGFDEATQQRPCESFSGGWRMRVALASALFAAPDLLLLDEPTNYLDLEGALWLESFLGTYPHTVLLASHDRDLLNQAVGGILHLSQAKLALYTGGYDRFEATRREQQRLQSKLRKKQDDQRRHIESYVERFRYQANKARQAQSRLKALARMQPIAAQVEDRVPPFLVPDPEKPLGNPLVRIEGASAGYGDITVLRDLDLRIDVDDRIGLLGANGNGKSTLAKLISGRLAPLSGTKRSSKKLDVGYFSQHQLDEIDPTRTPYDHVVELMPDATEAQKRARLGQIGFGIEKADVKAQNLSGGEKARLLFAVATFHGPHLLILDEPTNHLDVDSREVLIRALNDYDGAIILISHDRHLIEATVDRLWIVADGTALPYDGDIDQYRRECLSTRGGARASKTDDDDGSLLRQDRQAERRATAARRAELAPLKKQMTAREAEVETLTKRIATLDGELSDGSLYDRDPDRVAQLVKERGEAQRLRDSAEEAWLEASEVYETAKQ